MRFMIINFFLCYWLVSCFGLAYAGRPLATDDAGVVDKGHFEMEAGLEYANQTDKEVGLSLVIKRGMLDNLDLGIEIPYTFIDFAEGATSDGFGDINLSAKLNLLKEQDNLPAMAVSFQLKTDSGNDDKSLGTGKREYAVNYIASKSIAESSLHVNLGYTLKDDLPEQNLRDVITYGLAVEYPLADRLNLVGEISGENERRGNFDDNPLSGLIGLNYSLSEAMVCDLGCGFEISEASPDFKVTAGLTFSF